MTEGGPAKDHPHISSLGGVLEAVTVSQGSPNINAPNAEKFQAPFLKDEILIKAFAATLSVARFSRYMGASKNKDELAIEIYSSNARLAQSLYIGIQIWEVALRNRLSDFLIWKYGKNWPFDEKRAVRSLIGNDKRRLKDAVGRQTHKRGKGKVTTNHIVADLSAGFWVSLLTSGYDVPFSWRYNLSKIFPYEDMDRAAAAKMCEGILDLRNRIAHHEPVFHLPLEERRRELGHLIRGMCSAHHAYLESACSFQNEWKAHSALMVSS